MLTGRVNGDLQAWLTVAIVTPSGQPRPIEVALETGCNGQIALPAITIQRLELSEEGSRLAITATGDRVRLTTYYSTMMWHGEPRIIEVVEPDSEPLLGMELLLGNRGGRARQRASSGHGTPTRQPSHPRCPRRRASNHLSPLLATHPGVTPAAPHRTPTPICPHPMPPGNPTTPSTPGKATGSASLSTKPESPAPQKRAVGATFPLRVPMPARFNGKYDPADRPSSTPTLLKPGDGDDSRNPEGPSPNQSQTPDR